jgi:alginate production protein
VIAATAALLAAIALSPTLAAQERASERIEVKGRLDENGVFVAESATRKDGAGTSTKQELVGPAFELNAERRKFILLGIEIDLEDDGAVEDVDGAPLAFESLGEGDWVRVEGKRRTDEFEARKVRLVARAGDPKAALLRPEIEGPVEAANGTVKLAGFDVRLPATGVDLESEGDRSRVGPRVVRSQGRLGYRAVDEEDYRPMRFRPTEDVQIGGSARVDYGIERNYDLDRSRHTSVSEITFSADVRVAANLSDRLFGFVEGRGRTNQIIYDQDRDLDPETKAILGETFLFYDDIFDDLLGRGLDAQVGRQDFDEYREWLYDADLDAVRLFYTSLPIVLEGTVGTVLYDAPDADEDIVDYVLHGSYVTSKTGQVSAYVIDRENWNTPDRRINFGLRGREEPLKDLDGWFEAALSRGELDGDRLNGWALDAGATYVVEDSPVEPSFTLGFAVGSGDRDTEDGENGNFRQTGLQDNNSRWNGVTSFRYYGEVLEPELSNLRITTLGLGIRPTKRSSIDLIHHYVWQDETAVALLRPISNLRQNTNGEHGILGHEFDLVFGVKDIENVKIEVVVGTFMPGNAFDKTAPAYLLQVQIDFRF